jgi:hypothetical protein
MDDRISSSTANVEVVTATTLNPKTAPKATVTDKVFVPFDTVFPLTEPANEQH